MRVLLVSDFFAPVRGGLEHHVDGLGAELARRGDTVVVATLTRNPTPSSTEVAAITVATAARVLPHERADRPFHPPLPEPVTRRSLRRIIRDFRPDIVHAHSWMAVSLGRLDVPMIFTAHDYGLVCQLRTLLRSDGALCDGPDRRTCVECGTAAYGKAKSTVMTTGTSLGRRLLSPDHVLAVSDAVRDRIAPRLSSPVTVVPNFVAPEPEPEPLPPGFPTSGFVLYAGDTGAHKGLPDLLSLWRAADPIGVPLVVASTVPWSGVAVPNVVHGSLTPGQIACAMRSAALVVVPSRWRDPCPTVVLEAMRAGTPVVGTHVGGIPEMVRDHKEGLLVAPGDSAALGAAIRRLLDDQALRERLADGASARVQEYSVAAVTSRIREQYQQLLQPPVASRT